MRTFSKEVVEAVRYYNKEKTLSKTQVAKKYNTDRHMMLKVERVGLENLEYSNYLDMYYGLTSREKNVLDCYLKNKTCSFMEIKRLFGMKGETTKRLLRVVGEDDARRYKHQYNRDAFKEIKTEEDAYILGFILADGYVNEDRGFLKIKLNARDEDILEKILEYMGSDNQVKYELHNLTGNKLAYIEFDCKELVNTLVGYGIRQAKSCKERPIDTMPDHLQKHFIRGYFDGDGYIRKDGRGIGVCGSKEVCEYIRVYVENNIKGYTFNSKSHYHMKEANLWRLEYVTKPAVKVIEHLYQDSTIYLNRKYELAQKAMAMYKSDKNGER